LNDKGKKISRRCFARQGSLAAAAGFIVPLPSAAMIPAPGERPAMYQEVSARGVVCMICPNECTLKDGELSDCHNRIARKSKLYTMAFGNPCAANIDPVEKKPLYHFLPGTKAFSIRHGPVATWPASTVRTGQSRRPHRIRQEITTCHLAALLNRPLPEVAGQLHTPIPNRFTFYEYVLETSKEARSAGIKNIMVSTVISTGSL